MHRGLLCLAGRLLVVQHGKAAASPADNARRVHAFNEVHSGSLAEHACRLCKPSALCFFLNAAAAFTPPQHVLLSQIEVQNKQHYSFDRGHSIWRRLLLPHGDLHLSVLTRLTLSSEHKVGAKCAGWAPLSHFANTCSCIDAVCMQR